VDPTNWMVWVGTAAATVAGGAFIGWVARLFEGDDSPAATPPAPESCVACGSYNLRWPAPEAYVCGNCSHEGGEGRALHESHQRVETLRTWPEERLSAHVDGRWKEALGALDDSLRQLGGVGVGTALAEAFIDAGSDGDVSDTVYLEAAAAAQLSATALMDVSALHPDVPLLDLPFVDVEPGDFSRREAVQHGDRVSLDLVDLYTAGDIRDARAQLQIQRDQLVAWGRTQGMPMGSIDA